MTNDNMENTNLKMCVVGVKATVVNECGLHRTVSRNILLNLTNMTVFVRLWKNMPLARA